MTNHESWLGTEIPALFSRDRHCDEYLDVIKWRDAERAGTPLAPLNTLPFWEASMSALDCPCPGVECKPIPGFDGYHASRSADIWSCRRGDWRKLKTWINRRGYRCVGPFAQGRQVKRPVSWFVALAFHGAPAKGMDCRHLNGDKTNDRPENLAWGTRAENAQDCAYYGGFGYTVVQVHEARKLAKENVPYPAIATRLGLTEGQVNGISRGTTAGYVPEPDGSKYQPHKKVFSTPPELKAKIIADRSRGLTIRQIAKKYCITKDRVWHSVKGRFPTGEPPRLRSGT